MRLNFSNWSELKKYFPDISFSKSLLKELILSNFKNSDIVDVNIIFVGINEITKLNSEFRKKNEPTDVLTFTIEQKPLLGEIYICPEYISKKYKEEEILRNIVHGLLHLSGYEHKGHFKDGIKQTEEIFVKQENILDNIQYEINNRIGKSRKKIFRNKT